MKILVVSDSHHHDEILKELVKLYPNMDLYLHAGDSESDSYSLYPFVSIRGNCDYFSFDEKRLFKTEFGNILIKHFPYLYKNEKDDLFIFIHGHTHHYEVHKEDNYTILNPGSIAFPRDNSHGTYAIISLEKDKKYIDVIDIFSKNILTHYEIM